MPYHMVNEQQNQNLKTRCSKSKGQILSYNAILPESLEKKRNNVDDRFSRSL